MGETYETFSVDNIRYYFQSEGERGVITKVVVFQPMKNNNFNLAFGDLQEDLSINDKVVSNNNDAAKVLATVAKCVYDFLEKYKNSIIHIKPVDERRKILYNYIFRKREKEIEINFRVLGLRNGILESYENNESYDKFILKQKTDH